jgi:HD-GYP domain-containing protein (c-di-GMP phosphodiesterase class II)
MFPWARAMPIATQSQPSAESRLLLSEVIAAFSYALDLTEGQPPGHCLRSCWIGVHVGKQLGLDAHALWDLYYTLLLKDAGCSSNAARLCELYGADDHTVKRNFKTVDADHFVEIAGFVLKHAGLGRGLKERYQRIMNLAAHGQELATELVQTRCERGAAIARQLGFSEVVAMGIHCLDEHWNGNGRPERLKGNAIPLESRIALLSQVADVFHSIGGAERACAEVHERRGSWFDPAMVDAFDAACRHAAFWEPLSTPDLEVHVRALEPESRSVVVDDDHLDAITAAFGQVVDSKSPYTYGHSGRVAMYADAVGEQLGLTESRRRWLHRGALLHDIGKLGVSNSVLDKNGSLTAEEWEQVRAHARYTEEILLRLSPFAELALVAGAHHERLDGKGYPKGLAAPDIAMETRIITLSDIFDALTAVRPYRGAIPVHQSIEMMEKTRGTAIDSDCLDALYSCLPRLMSAIDAH